MIIKFIKENKDSLNEKNEDGNTPLVYSLRYKNDENIIKLLINNKTDFNQKNNYGCSALIIALINNHNENIIKLLINNKTDLNRKNNSGDSPFKLLLENQSGKNLSLILSFFYFFNKEVINIIKLIINDSNYKFFLEIPVFNENDIWLEFIKLFILE